MFRRYKKDKSKTKRIVLASLLFLGLILLCVMDFTGFDFKIGHRVWVSREDYEEFRDFKKLVELRIKIDDLYYMEYDSDLLEEGAIAGMFQALPDNYSRYYNKEEMADKNAKDKGEYVGIGITIFQNTNMQYEIGSVEEGRPASLSGLKAGDIILSVDGINLDIDTYEEVLANIKNSHKKYKFFGEYNKLHVLIDRDGTSLEFTIDKEKITTNSVYSEITDGVAYIRLDGFIETSYKDFKSEMEKVKEAKIQSLILDLRDNPGGLVAEAVKIAGYFVGEEVIYQTKSIHEEVKNHKSNIRQQYDGHLVLLVNDKSASASELLTAALKDYERAKIIGTKTFGKGIIQTTYPLSDGSGFKLTTKEYLTPKGANIHKQGIEPDVTIIDAEEQLLYAKEILKSDG